MIKEKDISNQVNEEIDRNLKTKRRFEPGVIPIISMVGIPLLGLIGTLSYIVYDGITNPKPAEATQKDNYTPYIPVPPMPPYSPPMPPPTMPGFGM